MKPKQVYLFLGVLGLILPYWQFFFWLASHGPNGSLFLTQLFAISAFFGMDVFVSAAVLLCFMRIESGRISIAHRWAAVIATVLVGVSLGLPLYL